ncbi:putative ABC transporter permease/ATP-binding protein [Arthrobacter globiformis NBRC 12137]|uniref:Putative ABC transporter permease/ATP-binding protein n=1 Tax=Arthrobacter globiformis (strain ATCC 8010 / DSM 20124 / JCM 1332 / NBRC 12137 / NCIMB 8907 / NRRL B-2979 / 168) TaxID=1077972 RepID=H0QSD5_ARTG1|nr:putative ABC transporter permease/ATP-binding protein [Arthrobacter globiformis NBRC 12137]
MLIGLMLRLLGEHRAAVWAIIVLQVVQTAGNLLLPTLNASIIDDGILANQPGVILGLGGWMLVLTAVQAAAALAAGYLGADVAMKIGHRLRRELFAQVQAMSSQEIGTFGAPSLVTRATNDVQQIQTFAVLVFTMLAAAPVMGIGGIILAIQQNAALSSVVIVIVPVLVLIMYLIVRRLIPLYRQGQALIDGITRILREQIIGANVIRGFVRQKHEVARFTEANRRLTSNNLQSALLVAGMLPMIMIVVNLSSVAVVWFGGQLIGSGNMEVGALTALIAYILQILLAIMMAMYVFSTAPRAAVCAERIQAVLDVTPALAVPAVPGPAGAGQAATASAPVPTIAVPAIAEPAAGSGGGVEFSHVWFAYPGAESPVLADISFTAGPGTTTAIIGATGSGKTTLLNLLPRFLNATSGEIRLGGADIRKLPADRLRERISVVPQHSYLFSGTVAGNLRMAAPGATEDDLWRALRLAQAEDFVRLLPDGLHAAVAQGGAGLSGGQRQRLCIARAMLRTADLYLFDDSFSALDYATEAAVTRALEPVLAAATVLMVAERIPTIMGADLILVLDEGRLVAQGTHTELLVSSPTYREIAESQLALDEQP